MRACVDALARDIPFLYLERHFENESGVVVVVAVAVVASSTSWLDWAWPRVDKPPAWVFRVGSVDSSWVSEENSNALEVENSRSFSD